MLLQKVVAANDADAEEERGGEMMGRGGGVSHSCSAEKAALLTIDHLII